MTDTSLVRAQYGGFGRSFWHVFAGGSKACKASQMLAVNVISRPFQGKGESIYFALLRKDRHLAASATGSWPATL